MYLREPFLLETWIKTELVKVSTSAIYALSKDHPEVGQSLSQRLRDAAMFGELCAHCGFAHRIVDCPLLCQEVAKSQEAAAGLYLTLRVGRHTVGMPHFGGLLLGSIEADFAFYSIT